MYHPNLCTGNHKVHKCYLNKLSLVWKIISSFSPHPPASRKFPDLLVGSDTTEELAMRHKNIP